MKAVTDQPPPSSDQKSRATATRSRPSTPRKPTRAIWEYGSASVLNNPLFGVGFGDWARASWMPSSVDMFWLLNAMRFGLPAGLLMLSAFFMLFLAVSFRKGLDDRLNACRTAYLIVMASFFVVGWTVHFWGEAYNWFLFLLGSGAWLLDVRVDRTVEVGAGGRRLARRTCATVRTGSRGS